MANKRPFESDLTTAQGKELRALLARPELLSAMLDAVYVGKPPAQAVAAVIALEMGAWAKLHRSRQLIGHLVHERLSPHCVDRGIVGRIKHPEVVTTGRTYWLTPAAVLTRVLLKSGVRARPARAEWEAVGALLEAYGARRDPDDQGAYTDAPTLRASWRREHEGRGWVASDLGDELEFVAAPGALTHSIAGAAEDAGAWRWVELAAKARRDGVLASVEEVRRATLNGGVEGGWEVGAHDPVSVEFVR